MVLIGVVLLVLVIVGLVYMARIAWSLTPELLERISEPSRKRGDVACPVCGHGVASDARVCGACETILR